MRIIDDVFARVPTLEVLVRVAYWRSAFLHTLLGALARPKRKPRVLTTPTVCLAQLQQALRDHGVAEGAILIVHSSMQALKCTGAKPSEIIAALRAVVGERGTLVMPAIPRYAEAELGVERVRQDALDDIWVYDVQRTPPWTGALPHQLMRERGAKRSRAPLNTVVAQGPAAELMMAREGSRPGAAPCGPESAWAYCAEHDAVIVALGVDLVHSLTMIHVAEDCHEESWPARDWYRRRRFLVRDNGHEEVVEVRERHPKWAMHYAERAFARDLIRHRVMRTSQLQGLAISSVRARTLLAFLDARKATGYPYVHWKWSQR